MAKKTIGLNPLEDYLSITQEPEFELSAPEYTFQAQSVKKQRLTIHIPVDLVDRVKNAVYWEPGLTVASFAEGALAKAVEDLEAERGGPYPERKEHQLRGGRPLK